MNELLETGKSYVKLIIAIPICVIIIALIFWIDYKGELPTYED